MFIHPRAEVSERLCKVDQSRPHGLEDGLPNAVSLGGELTPDALGLLGTLHTLLRHSGGFVHLGIEVRYRLPTLTKNIQGALVDTKTLGDPDLILSVVALQSIGHIEQNVLEWTHLAGGVSYIHANGTEHANDRGVLAKLERLDTRSNVLQARLESFS